MSGALDSVFGGNGGILGAVGGIVGEVFGGPIGEMLGQAIGNMLQQAIGDAVKGAAQDLQDNHGMPGFVKSLVNDAVDQTMGQLQNNDVSPDAQQAAQDQYGNAMQNWQQQFQQGLVNNALQNMGDMDSKPSGSKSGGGWLQAIARAMGQTMGEKAKEMVHLSNEMSQLQGSGSTNGQDAQQFNEDMTQFQATSQEYSMLSNVFSTAIKSLGDSLSTMARKQ